MSSELPDVRPPVVVVTGPTATGKTSLAIALAQRFDGEIINADSMQVYRYMDVGTAKPSLEERRQVPHHLIDVVDPDAHYSAGRYADAARAAARRIHGRGRIPLLTGGTGLYIRAFLEGLIPTGDADPDLREQIEREHARAVAERDPHRLHRQLEETDPEAAARIHPNDARRICRALEIARTTGSSTSRVRAAHGFGDRPYRVLHLALDLERDVLGTRIDARCRAMVNGGLLQEMRDLLERGYGPELRPMQAIGYRHMVPVVEGRETLANALSAMCTDTRRFARRQRTWLRAVPEVIWVDPRDPEAIARRVETFLDVPAPGQRPVAVQNGTVV
jgi:tRNA dimethylallyltransferase